jgi:NTP pyrophosphatase (non-canonical NTP hydrolase)
MPTIEKEGFVTADVDEALEILQEECAEVIQVICKIERFGIDSYYPETTISNHEKLTKEVGDLLAMVDILVDRGVLDTAEMITAKQAKTEKLKHWSNLFDDEL